MLERRYVLEHLDEVKRNCARRGVTADVDRFAELEHRRKAVQAEVDALRQQANAVSKSIGKAASDAEREERKAEGRRLREQVAALETELSTAVAESEDLLRAIPNLTHPDAPVGADEAANRVLRQGATPRPTFDFQPRDHVELAERLGLVDLEGGAKIAGHGFYFLTGDAVLLELALQRFAVGLLIDEGFRPMITPDLARNEVLEGIGFMPRGPETQIYSIEGTDLSLVATAEITLGGLLSNEIVDAERLPIKLCGTSHCFRTEAGAHGRATRGIYRVHQFTKVEMFAFTAPEESDAMHQQLCDLECRIFDALEIPYRVIDTATGDLGGPAYRKFDLEAWMPGRGDGGEYGEITSTSNCTDYQARRLGIRYRTKGEKGTHFVHTLNGTAVAITRALIAILENNQQADGSVILPKVLQPLVDKERLVPAE